MEDTCESQIQASCACLKTDYPVSFAIFALARSHRAKAASMLAGIGLFPGQEILLMQLSEKDGKPQKALCDSIGLDHSTVAKSLLRLEREGLVSQVYLTQKGWEMTHAITGVWSELERMTVEQLTVEEQAQLMSAAKKIMPQMVPASVAP